MKLAVAFIALFVALGFVLIPYAGVQADEAIFAQPHYQPFNRDYGVTIFHRHITLMVFPYTGALKTLIYWPIVHIFDLSLYSIRVPTILMGAATILLFYLLARKLANEDAAIIGAALLATDPTFLITNTFDWGPVAVEHLLLVAGCLAVAEGSPVPGFFLFGLALWNKAIFIWAIAGLTLAVLIAYRPRFDSRMLARCAAAFLIGALPLIVYNIHRPNATFGPNAHYVPAGFAEKITQLENTLSGSDLFGYIVDENQPGVDKPPRSAFARFSRFVESHDGGERNSLFAYAVLLALFAAPLWWRSGARRAAIFAIVFTVVSFTFMAITGNGGSAHHIVLLWPMPQLLVGIAVAMFRPGWLKIGITAALVLTNLLVVNQYIAQLDRNGALGSWNDAFFPLSNSLPEATPETIEVADWGIMDNANLMHHGKLNVDLYTGDNFHPEREYIGRVPGARLVPALEDKLFATASAAGYKEVVERTIPDSNGRPIFEVFRFQPSQEPATQPSR